jgi:hypothetical protein
MDINMKPNCLTRFLSTPKLVSLRYSDLNSKHPISDKIYQAFSKEGLGVLTISDIPRLASTKSRLLAQSSKLLGLSKQEKSKLVSHLSGFKIGWNEQKSPFGDIQASFLANPQEDSLGDQRLCNLWPNSLPYFRSQFRDVGQILIETCLLLSSHVDFFLEMDFPYSLIPRFEHTIQSSLNHMGCLSHSRVQSQTIMTLKPWQSSSSIFSVLIPPTYLCESSSDMKSSDQLLCIKYGQQEIPILTTPDSVCFLIGKEGEKISEGLLESKSFIDTHDEKNSTLIRTSFSLSVNSSDHPFESNQKVPLTRVYAKIN